MQTSPRQYLRENMAHCKIVILQGTKVYMFL